MINLAQKINQGVHTAKLIFNSFTPEQQWFLLPCADTGIFDSEMQWHLREPKITEAAGAYEAAPCWIRWGPPQINGVLNLDHMMINRLERRGANIIPKDDNPESYLEQYRWLAAADKSGSL